MKSEDRKRLQPSRQLAALLREAIKSGQLRPGDQLPSERNLAESHHVARNTARESLRLLAEEGLVTIEHGRGAFVRVQPKLMRFGASRYSKTLRNQTGLSPYRAEVEAQGKVPHVDCASISVIRSPEFVADRLGLLGDTQVVRRENHYFADEAPTQIGVTYIPVDVAGNTVLANSAQLGPGSLYARFEERGHKITRIREEVSSRMPTPEEVEQLRIPDGVPVLEVIHTSFDQNDRAFELTTFLMRADLSGLDYTMAVEA